MSKERRTVSLETEVDEYLGSEGVNASELVNSLVKNHVSSGGDKRGMLELRAEQLRSDIDELEGRLETKREELDRVETHLDEYRTERDEVLDEAVDTLQTVAWDADNPAIQNWAEKADMTPEELIEELERRDST